LIIIVITTGLLLTGIVELKVNKEKFFILPDITSSVLREKSAYEQGRSYAVSLKRRAEQLVVQNKEKRLVLALLYVKSDAARLEELIEKNADSQQAAILLPQAELLISSIDRVRRTAEKAPVAVIADLKQDSEESFANAQEALRHLQEVHDDYEEIGEEFTRLTESLEDKIGTFDLNRTEEEVAGEKNVGEQDESEPEKSAIPLKF